jgi:hypothetical protein
MNPVRRSSTALLLICVVAVAEPGLVQVIGRQATMWKVSRTMALRPTNSLPLPYPDDYDGSVAKHGGCCKAGPDALRTPPGL